MAIVRVCPQCKAQFKGGEPFCPYDATALVSESPAPAAAEEDPLLGKLLADRYQLRQVLGRGGMGVVYLADHRMLDRQFAVKVLPAWAGNDPTARARFEREAKASTRVSHPHIVRVYDYGQTESGLLYLVMEFLMGQSLRRYVRNTGPLNPGEAVDIALAVAEALRHAHEQGVIHRDIKPENVMLTAQDGRSDYVKVLDFGIARIADEAAVTKYKDGAPGTLEFMAPELFTTHNAPVPAIDQYALGILLYDILTGSPPFMGSDMEIVHAHLRTPPPRLASLRDPDAPVIPEALEDLAAALIAKDPKQRPTGAQTVARLMGLRPQLPPRSLRGVLALRTQVLAASQVGLALQAAQTFVLPYNRPDFAQTAQLQSVLRQLDEVEDQIARLGEQLVQRSEVLHKKRWPGGLPDVLTQIQQQIHAQEKQEEELGLQLALLREEAATQERREQGRRDDLFRRLLAQREIARARPAQTPEERRIQEEAVLALERAYHQPAVLTEAAQKLAAEQAKWQSLREELSSLRRQLAGQTLRCFLLDLRSRGAAEPGQQVAYEALEQALQTFDEQSAAVTVLCAQLPRNG